MSARPQGACCANAEGTKEKNANAQTSFMFILLLMFTLSASLRLLPASELHFRGHTMLLQPELHQLNFRLLVGDDLLSQPTHLRVFAVQQDRFCHVNRALVMWNHHGNEVTVRLASVSGAMHSLVHHIHRVAHQLIECPFGRSG